MQLTTLNATQWQDHCNDLPPPCREVYFQPAYAQLCARWERATAHCLRIRDDDGWLLYPYLAHPIDADDRHDIQTPYGYGGPLFIGDWPLDRRVAALHLIREHLRAAGAVAEFVRCHTEWLDPDTLRAADYKVFQVRTNVECDLTTDDVTATWAPAARRNLRKAQNANLTWRTGSTQSDWHTFESLYIQTAKRLEMPPSYRFDSAYFAALSQIDRARLLLVEHDRTPIAAAILFLGGALAHYHLGASDFAHQHLRPNDFLYFAMATCAKDAGCRRIVWGGGLSNDPADTLFRFKSHFGHLHRPAFAAGKVIDQPAYDRLCNRWRETHPGATFKLFLAYRA
jgi:hypothetical protein